MKYVASLLLIFIVGLSVRTYIGLKTMPFSQDQARDVVMTESLIKNKTFWVYLGPKTSIGDFYLPPLYYQINLWLARISNNNPHTMMWFSIIIESFTALLIFLIVSQCNSKKIAIIPAILYTLSPFIVPYSVIPWNPATIPFFSTLFLFSGLKYYLQRSKVFLLISILTLTVCTHFHFQAAVLFPFALLGVLFILWKRKEDIPIVFLGMILSAATFIPYVIGEVTTNWSNSLAIINYFKSNHSQIYDRVSKPDYVIKFLPDFFDRLFLPYNSIHKVVGYLIFIGGLISLGYKSTIIKNYSNRYLLIFFLLLVVSIRFYRGDKLDFYLSILFVWPYILLGSTLQLVQKFKLHLIIPIIIAFYMGNHWSQVKLTNSFDNYRQLASAASFNVSTSTVNLWLSNQENYYSLVYFLGQRGVTVNSSSQTLMAICMSGQNCNWSIINKCNNYRYLDSLLKTTFGYQHQSTIKLNEFIVELGQKSI